MDGYEMVRRIRETDDATPILFTSGRVSPKDVVKGYELGVNNYIKKPFLAERKLFSYFFTRLSPSY
jgi:DNA-binding response OmpR family regulator